MTTKITPEEVEALYRVYKQADNAFAAICAEQVDKNDPPALAAHVRRFDDARRLRQDTMYAWERAVALSHA